MPKRLPARTKIARVRVTRWVGGIGAPLHGSPCFELLDGSNTNQMYGLDLGEIAGEELGEGAEIEVSVRVIKKGRTIHNPWLTGEGKPNYRATSTGRATAKTCRICNPRRCRG